MIKFKNIEEWRQTREWDDHLAMTLKMYDENDSQVDMRGFIYADGGHIELLSNGWWNVHISNPEKKFDTLWCAENHLWTHHSAYNALTPREALIDEYGAYCTKHGLVRMSPSDLLAEVTAKRSLLQQHEFWLTDYCRRWDLEKN